MYKFTTSKSHHEDIAFSKQWVEHLCPQARFGRKPNTKGNTKHLRILKTQYHAKPSIVSRSKSITIYSNHPGNIESKFHRNISFYITT